jgi:hypothetical protein
MQPWTTPTRRVGTYSRAGSPGRPGGRLRQPRSSSPHRFRQRRRRLARGAYRVHGRGHQRGRWCAYRALYFSSIRNPFRQLDPFTIPHSRDRLFSCTCLFCAHGSLVHCSTTICRLSDPPDHGLRIAARAALYWLTPCRFSSVLLFLETYVPSLSVDHTGTVLNACSNNPYVSRIHARASEQHNLMRLPAIVVHVAEYAALVDVGQAR